MTQRSEEAIRDFLARRHDQRRLEIAELARHTGIRKKFLRKVITGERVLPLECLDATAAFFALDTPEFIQLARQEAPEYHSRAIRLVVDCLGDGSDGDGGPSLVCQL